jgi:hypothetical protein
MAWLFNEQRCCPLCAYEERILVTRTRKDVYRLSCGWCAYLSEPAAAHAAFFTLWDAPHHADGDFIDLQGVPHWYKGRYVESVPIRVVNAGETALVVPVPDLRKSA